MENAITPNGIVFFKFSLEPNGPPESCVWWAAMMNVFFLFQNIQYKTKQSAAFSLLLTATHQGVHEISPQTNELSRAE